MAVFCLENMIPLGIQYGDQVGAAVKFCKAIVLNV